MIGATCPRCRGLVQLHAGAPRITATGAIEIWCVACVDAGPLPRIVAVVTAVEPARTRRSRHSLVVPIAVAVAAVLLLVARLTAADEIVAAVAPASAVEEPNLDEDLAPIELAFSHELHGPPRHVGLTAVDRWPVADVGFEPLDHVFPSLAGWIHPVVDSPEPTPEQNTRWFGAARVGIEPREECGLGHCGVDLDGPRGRPVVAVADGVVIRVEHSELGRDGRSGRYVRLEHDDGTLTAYMHLDDIAEGLEVGDRVVAGEQIGTLGATAVYRAAPHLHFSLALPDHAGVHGDNSENHYIDPMPFLARAKVIKAPDRRRPEKAQW